MVSGKFPSFPKTLLRLAAILMLETLCISRCSNLVAKAEGYKSGTGSYESNCTCQCEVSSCSSKHIEHCISKCLFRDQAPKIIRIEVPKVEIKYIPVVVKTKNGYTMIGTQELESRIQRNTSLPGMSVTKKNKEFIKEIERERV